MFMAFYSNWGWYGYSRPQDLLYNEWVMFAIVFMLSFAMIYLALANFFYKKKNVDLKDLLLGLKDNSPAKGPVVVISLAVSLLIAFSLTQNNYLYSYLGAGATLGILIFSIIVFALLALPFYAAMEKSFSPLVAGPLFGAIVWFVAKYLFPSVSQDLMWSMPYEWYNFYQGLVSGWGLFWLLVIGAIIGLVKNKKGGSHS
jgi:hypothetical protein